MSNEALTYNIKKGIFRKQQQQQQQQQQRHKLKKALAVVFTTTATTTSLSHKYRVAFRISQAFKAWCCV
jgi:hypothetical protein